MYKGCNIKLTESDMFSDAFQQFQAYNRARNLSKKTTYGYETAKKSFIAYMGGDFLLNTVDEQSIQGYIETCMERGNSPITINTKLTALRTMFNFFAKREYIPKLPIKLIKADKPIKETYTDAELAILLKKPNMRSSGFDDYRNWVIINYLLGTGNRISSLQNIKIKDINFEEQEIILRHTKNRTQQIIPIAQVLKGILIEYLQIRKPAKSDGSYQAPVGYLQKETAKYIAPMIDQGKRCVAFCDGVTGGYGRHWGMNLSYVLLDKKKAAKSGN